MTIEESKITIHMVSSIDGFVAKKDDSVKWLESTDHYEKGLTLSEEAITSFLKNIDCYIMGSKTYEHALKLGWSYGDTPVIVLTKRNLPKELKTIQFYAGDLNTLVDHQLKSEYKNIWLVGGPSLVKDFLRLNLADEIVLSIIPIILGEGKLFFDYIGKEKKLHLKDVKAYKDGGIVELTYKIIVL